jgi:hypothetical protein
MPVELPVVAMAMLLTDQVPPGVALESSVLAFWQILLAPLIGSGRGFTVIVFVE